MSRRVLKAVALLILFEVTAAVGARGASVTLSPNAASPQQVGTRILWTATSDDPAFTIYQFSISRTGGPFAMVRDYSPANVFAWTPLDEGDYLVRVIARTGFGTTGTISFSAPFTVRTRLVENRAVVTATGHPLVALYSAPACGAGWSYVEFGAAGTPYGQYTIPKACRPGQSLNFLVAGMRRTTDYMMRHVVVNGSSVERSSPLTFRTGAPTVTLPLLSVIDPIDENTSVSDGVLLHSVLSVDRLESNFPFATDLSGRLLWYLDLRPSSTGVFGYVARPTAGGTMLVLADRPGDSDPLWEMSLAGQVLRETNRRRINEQLAARGQDPVAALHHEATRLPNGFTALLGMVVRLDGTTGQSVIGDMAIVLDANWQVAWTWNAFDHLDMQREVGLTETCRTGYGDLCPQPLLDARDALHTNSITYSPADRNLILSVRNQDWVIKIDYRDGQGNGAVIWRLGADGDFALNPSDPTLWFSRQHDARYVESNQLILFDNGNTRCSTSAPPCWSRGVVLELDESQRTATVRLSVDLGGYAARFGSAQKLTNGNFFFGIGDLGDSRAQSIEVKPDGTRVHAIQADAPVYRSFRMRTMSRP